MKTSVYCRAVESYLCRKNDGHLIRIVGPAFTLVCGWAKDGIPLSVVQRAIDQTYTRYYASGSKRRPVKIEYCESDVIDAFEEWRRAVGIGVAYSNDHELPTSASVSSSSRRRSLADHLDEVSVQLVEWVKAQVSFPGGSDLEQQVVEMASAVKVHRATVKGLRGTARVRVIEQLQLFDDELLCVARAAAGQVLLQELRSEAAASLEPFRFRMAASAFQAAIEASTDRLLAEYFRLPSMSYD